MSDQQQILRLLVTLREECQSIRSRQEELYSLLLSYKDQLHDLKATVVDKLAGLPKSPYIAGQLVPAPQRLEGVDDLRHVLATYLHRYTALSEEQDKPIDFELARPVEVKPEEIELEADETERPRKPQGGGQGGGRKRDADLSRGPDRDVEEIDLSDEPEGDDDDEGDDDEKADGDKPSASGKRRRRRGGRRRKKGASAE